MVQTNLILNSEIEKLKKEIETLKNSQTTLTTENKRLYNQSYYFKRKGINLNCSLKDMKEKLKEVQEKFDLSSSLVDNLQLCVSDVPKELFESTAKRAAGGRVRSYHPELEKGCNRNGGSYSPFNR